MQPAPPGHSRTLRLAFVAAALFVLLGIVAFSSRSGFGHPEPTKPTPGYLNWALSVFIVVFVLMIPVAIYAYGIQAREWRAKKERQSFGIRLAKRLAILLVIAVAFLLRIYFGHKFYPHFHSLFARTPPHAHVVNGHDANPRYQPTFQWPVLWATVGLFAAAVGAFFWYRRRHPTVLDPFASLERSQADEVAATIGDAIDDLEAEPDPRRAVIAAYARMESAFGRQGLKRDPSETAIEYLRRILLGVGSRKEPVQRLTGLFEQAKFSLHDVDTSMKRDAIDALRTIRADLQAAR